MASTSGVGGGGRVAPPSNTLLSTPVTGARRGRDSTSPTGNSPHRLVFALMDPPRRRAHRRLFPTFFNLPAAAVAGGAGPPASALRRVKRTPSRCTKTPKAPVRTSRSTTSAATTPWLTRPKRKAIIDGLENIRVYVVMLDNVADDLLDIGGDWTEESATRPTLEDVLVIRGACAWAQGPMTGS